MENGSDKASNGAFDDDPQKGAAEAKAALEIMMNESALVAANEGANATLGILASDSSLVPTNNSSIPLEGKELEERSDIPDFDSFQEYDENQCVKKQMDDGTYVLGTAYRPDNKNVSIFTACDKEAVSEHTSLISELKSCGYGLLGAANRFIESMSEDQKKRDFEFQLIINKNASKYGIDCPSEYMGFETKGKTVDELMHEWKENNAEWRNKNLRNNAPCKYLYDGSEIAGDIVIPFLPIGKGPLMWCGTKKVSVAKSGIKVASELKNGKALTESEIIASSGIGNLKGTKTSYVKSSEISEKAIKSIKKKWGQKGVDAFEKAMNKGIVGAEGQNGIKPLKGKPYKGKYTHEIKVKNKEYGDFRIYGYKDSSGKMIFECFDKGLH